MGRIGVLMALMLFSAPLSAVAQDQPDRIPQYQEQPQTPLDKNFGLPTFGMRGTEMPQQRTQAPERSPAEKPDFFEGARKFDMPRNMEGLNDDPLTQRPLTVTRTPHSPLNNPNMETPTYTTTDGSGFSDGSTREGTYDRLGRGESYQGDTSKTFGTTDR